MTSKEDMFSDFIGDLFGESRPVEETKGHGHRTTPVSVIRLLYAQPEFHERRGSTVDLGCGDGAIWRELSRLDGGRAAYSGVDVRAVADAGLEMLWQFDAALPWPAKPWWLMSRVVSNPPWSIQRCPRCHRTWDAGRCQHCMACSSPLARVNGQDLAQVMIGQAMRACTSADVWVIHTTDWRFHPQRARFFLPRTHPRCTRPPTHEWAGLVESGERVAWGDPSARGPVKPHNKMLGIYYFAPADRAPAEPWIRVADRLPEDGTT